MVDKASIGSLCSGRGVIEEDPVLEWLNQKYFFLFGGLPELRFPGDPEAERGRFGRLIMAIDLSAEVMPGESVERASAV